MAAVIELPEWGKRPVRVGFEPQRAVPQVVPTALVQDHDVDHVTLEVEQEVEGDLVSQIGRASCRERV